MYLSPDNCTVSMLIIKQHVIHLLSSHIDNVTYSRLLSSPQGQSVADEALSVFFLSFLSTLLEVYLRFQRL